MGKHKVVVKIIKRGSLQHVITSPADNHINNR